MHILQVEGGSVVPVREEVAELQGKGEHDSTGGED